VLAPAIACLLGPASAAGNDERPWNIAPPVPVIPLEPAVVPGLESYACLSCHSAVGDEWARSAHGIAWVDHEYRAALAQKKRPELCHGCHAPEPLLREGLAPRADARDGGRERGIACESCHLGPQGGMLGPRGTPVDAHPSRVSEHMSAPGSNALCALCHATNIGPVIGVAKDFISAGLESRGLSCVGCHMAPLERAWATDAPPRTGRSHALQTPRDPAFLRRALGIEWKQAGGGSRVVLTNQAGHRVPGLIGRQLRIEAELLDASDAVLERAESVIDERAYLPLGATREIPFGREGAAVRLRGLHTDPRAGQPVLFLEERLVR
jgi:hypothetical protein